MMDQRMLGVTAALWVALATLACGSAAPATQPVQTAPEATNTAIPSPPTSTLEPTPTAIIPTPTAAARPEVETKTRIADTGFSFRLFDQLVKQDGGENIFISPLSVAIALAMAYNGAEGETRAAMAKSLGIVGMW